MAERVKQPRDHWASFLAEMKKQTEKLDGFGEVTVMVKFHEGQPRGMRVLKREEVHILDGHARQEGEE